MVIAPQFIFKNVTHFLFKFLMMFPGWFDLCPPITANVRWNIYNR